MHVCRVRKYGYFCRQICSKFLTGDWEMMSKPACIQQLPVSLGDHISVFLSFLLKKTVFCSGSYFSFFFFVFVIIVVAVSVVIVIINSCRLFN